MIARASETAGVRKIYLAGVDYVLALSTVSGRMLASTILGEEMLSSDQQVVVPTPVGSLAGQTLAESAVRDGTGVTVVAVERDGEVVAELDLDFRFRPGDDVVVAGPDDAVTSFTGLFGRTDPHHAISRATTD